MYTCYYYNFINDITMIPINRLIDQHQSTLTNDLYSYTTEYYRQKSCYKYIIQSLVVIALSSDDGLNHTYTCYIIIHIHHL